MARDKVNDVRINAHMPGSYWRVAKRLAKQRGVSTSEILRTALKKYLAEAYEQQPSNEA